MIRDHAPGGPRHMPRDLVREGEEEQVKKRLLIEMLSHLNTRNKTSRPVTFERTGCSKKILPDPFISTGFCSFFFLHCLMARENMFAKKILYECTLLCVNS